MPYVATNGIQLYYEEAGDGPPLICIMGITGPGSVWANHVELWKRHFRCIMADNRGVGKSDMPSGPYTSAMMADDYAGLMDAMSIERARVIGCSMGSAIAQQLMLRHPQRVESAVLMCPWARCDRYARDVFEHLRVAKAKLTAAEFVRYLQLLIFAKPYWDNDASYETLMDGRRLAAEEPAPQPLHALEAQADACVTHDVWGDLQRVACRTLVIGGKSDIFTPPWMAQEIAARIPGCELHLYEAAGHAFHWECIDDFNPRIVRWFLGA
ncbi:alpha/beta fold hydrolase [Lacipirellula limnantheis]|uniref:Non-heme bromoperoxidase BpoC n=1 Tax=Lacipirellula limnantheis TaxID=2528024 RepID=A0A517U226_9BACT|nr:alpha/beta hydrolase [Lacipirellula limnantheis]QDT74663.1 Putative non-heme bromoperoxidase BpoC [Lacipirellula limnantheis]